MNNVKEKKSFVKEEKMNIEEFCVVKGLSKYHLDTFKMCYSNKMKTAKDWTNFLISNKMIKAEVLNS